MTAFRITSPGCGYETGRVKAHIVFPEGSTITVDNLASLDPEAR